MNNVRKKNTPEELYIFVTFLGVTEIRTDLPKIAKPRWLTKIKI